MAEIGRNEPCPCGSGRKFKQCHLGKEHELPGFNSDDGGGDASASGVPGQLSTPRLVMMLLTVIIALAGLMYFVVGPRLGVAVGGIGAFIVLVWATYRNPPPVRQEGDDSAAINFGSSNKGR